MSTNPTYQEVIAGATAADFIPDTGELVDRIAPAVQADIDDATDAMNANILAKSIIDDFEDITRLIPDKVKESMQEAFIQAVAQDKLSLWEATNNLDIALIEYDNNAGFEAWDDYDMRNVAGE